jgi:hypothetical protein
MMKIALLTILVASLSIPVRKHELDPLPDPSGFEKLWIGYRTGNSHL